MIDKQGYTRARPAKRDSHGGAIDGKLAVPLIGLLLGSLLNVGEQQASVECDGVGGAGTMVTTAADELSPHRPQRAEAEARTSKLRHPNVRRVPVDSSSLHIVHAQHCHPSLRCVAILATTAHIRRSVLPVSSSLRHCLTSC